MTTLLLPGTDIPLIHHAWQHQRTPRILLYTTGIPPHATPPIDDLTPHIHALAWSLGLHGRIHRNDRHDIPVSIDGHDRLHFHIDGTSPLPPLDVSYEWSQSAHRRREVTVTIGYVPATTTRTGKTETPNSYLTRVNPDSDTVTGTYPLQPHRG